jgi:hypothetical protein
VGGVLVSVATVILVSFHLLERSLRARLERFGLNSLVVRETVTANDPEMLAGLDRPDRFEPLEQFGEKVRLRQLFMRAQTEWLTDLPVMAYPAEAMGALAPWLDARSPIICLSETLPEFVQMRISLNHHSEQAIVRRPGDFWRPLIDENVLLVPQGWAPDAERVGFLETTLFRKTGNRHPMPQYVNAVKALYQVDRRPPPQIQSALPLLRELEDLQRRQKQWRGLLAGLLGLAMALVFGAIAVLEFRQNLYVTALLRSLGTPARFLYLRQWLENAFLANVAAVTAIAAIAFWHEPVFRALGFPRSVLDLAQSNPYWSIETGLILLWTNIGAFLSSLPVAAGLREPVGEVLN